MAVSAGTITILIILAGLATYAWQKRSEAVVQRGIAEAQRSEAVTQRGIAEAQRSEAVTQRGIAEAQRSEAVVQRGIAEAQRIEAVAGRLSAEARAEMDRQLDLALLLASAATMTKPTAQSKTIHMRALLAQPQLIAFVHHAELVTATAFSTDGKIFASGSEDGLVNLWDVERRMPLGQISGGNENMQLRDIIFSPVTQSFLAVYEEHEQFGPEGGKVQLWDVDHRAHLGDPYQWRSGGPLKFVFSPDGKILASGRPNGLIILWDVTGQGQLAEPLTGLATAVKHIVFSPDGKTLASADAAGIVMIWDLARQERRGVPLSGQAGDIASLAFSPDGKTLASADTGGTVFFWELTRPLPRRKRLSGHKAGVTELMFSRDGQTLASADAEGTVILWDLARQTPRRKSGTGVAAISPDGKAVAVAETGMNGTIRLWNVTDRASDEKRLSGHKAGVTRLMFSRDGQTLASADAEGTVILWDLAQETPHGDPLIGYKGEIESLRLSPDGRTLATVDRNENSIRQSGRQLNPLTVKENKVRLWDVKRQTPLGEPLAPAKGGMESVTSANRENTHSLPQFSCRAIVFSPNGDTLASGDPNGIITLWDEWRFLESNRWLYKEIYSRQGRPTSSLIEGALSSSIDQGAYHDACYRTYCCGTSTEPTARVPPGGALPVQCRADGQGPCRSHMPRMCRDR
jgi:WD40 repeat protein